MAPKIIVVECDDTDLFKHRKSMPLQITLRDTAEKVRGNYWMQPTERPNQYLLLPFPIVAPAKHR